MRLTLLTSAALLGVACASPSPVADQLHQYATVRLTADLSGLSDAERAMLPHLLAAAREMDPIFWQEAWGNGDSLLAAASDAGVREYLEINYGPWDRLAGNAPFVEGVGPKPAGANLYPHDLTRDSLQAYVTAHPDQAPALQSLYTLVRRDGNALRAVPYHEAFQQHVARASDELRAAANLAEDPGLKHYLELRADALLSDDYRPSDIAWMAMKNNGLDIVIGPIETYEDGLMGWKASHESYVLIKDREWSARLARYISFLPQLQTGLPVPPAYRRDPVGTGSDLNAYDVVYYAGEANAGVKTIAINLPNDEVVQQQYGTRRLQLKNAMRAKFDSILMPIANVLITPDQRSHVTFDAFFADVMFHEVAHGLGVKNTLDGHGTVRAALREYASAFEEEKADILGLYMITRLNEQGELGDVDLTDYYVTFLASIFRSVRFGTSDAHGRANMMTLNFLQQQGAFSRDADGTYRVHMDRMAQAMEALARRILVLQGDGDYDEAARIQDADGKVPAELQAELDRLGSLGIPVDIVFEQGPAVLGIN